MKYQVEVREQLARIVVVEAPTAYEAEELVRAEYENSAIVLDSNDMIGEEDIEVLEDEVPDDFEVDYTFPDNAIIKYCSKCHLKQARVNSVCERCGGEIHEGVNIQ